MDVRLTLSLFDYLKLQNLHRKTIRIMQFVMKFTACTTVSQDNINGLVKCGCRCNCSFQRSECFSGVWKEIKMKRYVSLLAVVAQLSEQRSLSWISSHSQVFAGDAQISSNSYGCQI